MDRFTPDQVCDELYHRELIFSDLKVKIKDLEIKCFHKSDSIDVLNWSVPFPSKSVTLGRVHRLMDYGLIGQNVNVER